jgi:hypothetical protein
MPEQQLRFFSRAKPLVERFGAQFFRDIPRAPGVYLMHAASQRLLYVGKARDLRQRLGSYRYISERTARKTIRLLHAVETISWELCASEPAACLRENELLRQHRPRFNRMNIYPQAYPFVELCPQETGFAVRITLDSTEHCYGAFKGNARAAVAALFRLLWARLHARDDYGPLPRALILERAPRAWSFAAAPVWFTALQQFLSGHSDVLLRDLQQTDSPGSEFHRQFRESDIELLSEFFARGPQRNRRALDCTDATVTRIAQEKLDDLLLLARPGSRRSSSERTPGAEPPM